VAVMAVAAVAGAAAVGSGVIAATTLAMVSIGVTAVGLVTKSKTLMAIGGGLGLGSAAASLMGLGQSAVGQAGLQAIDGANIADVTAAASGTPEAATLSGMEGVQAGAERAAMPPVASRAAVPSSPLNPFEAPLEVAPRSAPVAPSAPPAPAAAAATPPVDTAARSGGLVADAVRPPPATSSAPVAPGSTRPVVPAGQVNQTVNAGQTLEAGQSWFGRFWGGLDSSGRLAAAQTASGLISGVGQGAGTYMQQRDRNAFEQQQIDQRRRDRGYIPSLTPYARPS
jgi:hypothetical protein